MGRALVAWVVLASGSAAAVNLSSFSDYEVSGRAADGTAYVGALSVLTMGKVHRMTWEAGDRPEGFGLRVGEALAVAVGEGCGVTGYRIDAAGDLQGSWLAPVYPQAGNQLGAETATRAAGSAGLSGDYGVKGTLPDGRPYEGALTIRQAGMQWRFSWRTDREVEGVGIARGGYVAVAWGASECGVMLYRVAADGSLAGIWKDPGERIGVEWTSAPVPAVRE